MGPVPIAEGNESSSWQCSLNKGGRTDLGEHQQPLPLRSQPQSPLTQLTWCLCFSLVKMAQEGAVGGAMPAAITVLRVVPHLNPSASNCFVILLHVGVKFPCSPANSPISSPRYLSIPLSFALYPSPPGAVTVCSKDQSSNWVIKGCCTLTSCSTKA